MRQLKITKQITGRESYSIEKYLQEIGKIHVLSPEEEADLAKKIRSGDRAAREKLVLSNLRFVTYLYFSFSFDVETMLKQRRFSC